MFFDLAERAGGHHPLGIGGELAHGLHIGGEPGEPMRGALFAVEQAGNRMAFNHHLLAHLDHRVGQQGVEG